MSVIDINKPWPKHHLGLAFVLDSLRAAQRASPTEERATHVAWAEHLLGKVRWETRSPLLALAMWTLASNAEEREAFRKALEDIDRITKEAA